jgi:hypothetical protein
MASPQASHERQRRREQSWRDLEARVGQENLLLTRAEAAEFLRASVPTLERWAALGTGPEFRLVGGRALYRFTELRRFAGLEAA